MPKISVIIPIYNQSKFIKQAIDSVLQQSYQDFEIIVVDDGSTDALHEVLTPYKHVIQYIYKKNGGTASALNKGIRHSGGTWIAWLSADDMFMRDKLLKQIQRVEENLDIGLVYTSFYDVDVNGNISKEWNSGYLKEKADWAKWLLKFCFINGSSVMIRKDILYSVGLFDESLPYAHDYDMWLRLLPYCDFAICPEPLLKYRRHDGSTSHRMNMDIHHNELEFIKQRAYELYKQKGLV